MSAINYSRIACPYSTEPIAECECQNCVIARMDAEYERWQDAERGMLAARVAVVVAFFAFAYGVFRMVSR